MGVRGRQLRGFSQTKVARQSMGLGAFAVLAVLAKSPSTSREVSIACMMSMSQARTLLNQLERLGWVIQRKKDGRWVMRVVLAPIAAVVPTGAPGEEPGMSHVVQGTDGVLGPELIRRLSPDEPRRLNVIGRKATPIVEWRSKAERLAQAWNLPLEVRWSDGELNIGVAEVCVDCGKRTPVHYGPMAICPKCVRVRGGEVVPNQAR